MTYSERGRGRFSPLLCPKPAQAHLISSVRLLSLPSRKVPLRGHWELCAQHGEALLPAAVLCPPLPLNSPERFSQILPPSLHLRTMMADLLGRSPSISKMLRAPRNLNVQQGWNPLRKHV